MSGVVLFLAQFSHSIACRRWGMRLVVRALALMSLLLLSSCDGPSIGHGGARAYFTEHREALQRVSDLALACRPPTGRLDRTDSFSCATAEDADDLRSAMENAHAQWIYVTYNGEDENRSVHAVQVILHSYGVAYAGVVEGFVFETAPKQSGGYQREDDGISVVERMPVTDPPHQWYWRKIDR